MDKISIVLVNWNGADDTIECLKSLYNLNYPDYDIYLVDNNSEHQSTNKIEKYLKNSDYSFKMVDKKDLDSYDKDDDTDVLFILNDVNAGFAGGNNVALEYIMNKHKTDYILLLNNDTVVEYNLLSVLVNKIKSDESIGFVGARHYFYDNPNILQTVGGGMIDLVHGEATAADENSGIKEFDFITGSCILTSYDVLCDIGVINPGYFMYWEDVDWSTCARENGYKLVISDDTYILHKEGASIKSLRRIYYHTRNRIWYMKNNTDKITYYKFIIYICLYVFKESFENILKNKKYSKTLLKGLKDGLLHKGLKR